MRKYIVFVLLILQVLGDDVDYNVGENLENLIKMLDEEDKQKEMFNDGVNIEDLDKLIETLDEADKQKEKLNDEPIEMFPISVENSGNIEDLLQMLDEEDRQKEMLNDGVNIEDLDKLIETLDEADKQEEKLNDELIGMFPISNLDSVGIGGNIEDLLEMLDEEDRQKEKLNDELIEMFPISNFDGNGGNIEDLLEMLGEDGRQNEINDGVNIEDLDKLTETLDEEDKHDEELIKDHLKPYFNDLELQVPIYDKSNVQETLSELLESPPIEVEKIPDDVLSQIPEDEVEEMIEKEESYYDMISRYYGYIKNVWGYDK